MHLITRRRIPLPARLGDERGYSLVEVLVAMVAGIIVTGALFGILEVSLKQNSRITDRVQAQQLGDNAMTRIIDPLRSGCFSREATPVLLGSTGTLLIFTTSFSEATTPAASEVFKETVEYNSGKHKLFVKTQKATAGSWPTYTAWEEPGKSTMLAENVYLLPKREYAFRYYKYAKEATPQAKLSPPWNRSKKPGNRSPKLKRRRWPAWKSVSKLSGPTTTPP